MVVKRKHKSFYCFFFSLLLLSTVGFSQQVAINEIMSSNAETVSDIYGDYEDWIELYNYGSTPVDLEGYWLSDDYGNPFRWVFPSVVIEPGEYLLVWASGKAVMSEDGWVNGVMREVYSGIPGHNINHLVNHPDYPDNPSKRHLVTTGFDAPVNVDDHYGQRMHAYLEAPETGAYIFWIASDDNGLLYLSTDDDPENITAIASVPGWTHHMEWDKYPEQQSDPVWLEEGNRYYIKALMKEHEGGDNLSVRWQLPSGTVEAPIPNARLFWDEMELHASFSIASDGEEVLLSRPDGSPVDEHPPISIPTDISYGRQPDGTGDWYFFKEPTPGKSNDSETFSGVLSPPFFSSPGGFYQEAFGLSIHHPEEDVTIVYTLDGSEPSDTNLDGSTYHYKKQYRKYQAQQDGGLKERGYISKEYSEPISVKDKTGREETQTVINTVWEQQPVSPYEAPLTGTVVRTRACKDGYISSEVATSTYIIRHDPYPLPVVSLVLPEKSVFCYYEGIYVPGLRFDEWRSANWHAHVSGGSPANFHNRGIDWERETSFEFFDASGVNALNHRAGVRIHGGYSRSFPQKSLRLYARGRYGTTEFEHQLFPSKDTKRFKRFIMRTSGNDHHATFFRDALIQQMVLNRPVDVQHWQPVMTFINGEFWGILNVRDRYDKYYLYYKYGIDPDNVDILEGNARVKEGGGQHYNNMMDYVVGNDMGDSSHYDHVNTMMDIDNFAEYYAIQIYINNRDWPGNNIDFWRLRTDAYEPDAPNGHDGRWRWMLYDTDFGFGIWGSGAWENMLEFAAEEHGPGWPNPPWSTRLYRNLLDNQDFRHKMVNRLADLMNCSFHPDSVLMKIDEMKEKYEPVMAGHIDRWTVIGSMNNWNNQINVMRNFAEQRPGYMKEHIKDFFDLSGHYNLTVNLGSGRGRIRINTVEIKDPDNWKGVYFNGVPIEIEAIPGAGYSFSHWEGASDADTISIGLTGYEDMFLEAHFEPSVEPRLITFWVFDGSMPNDTPFETIEDSFHAIHPAQISFHSALDGYPFYPGHANWRKASMERRNRPTDINYRPEGNNGVDYGDSDMRGLQVRQPFTGDNGENTLVFHLPTCGFKDIVFRFAAKDEGAADFLLADYSLEEGAGNWLTEGVGSTTLELTSDYVLYKLDFGDINGAVNNPDFKIRIRFDGDDIAADDGDRTTFNNISLDGVSLDEVGQPPEITSSLSLKKGIEEGEAITIDLNKVFKAPGEGSLEFSASSSRPELVSAEVYGDVLKLTPLKRGGAHIAITAEYNDNPAAEHSFRVLVYPKAHPMTDGEFRFSEWDANHPEFTYPENMLFLQSDIDDPGLAYPLLAPYHIEHDDYHQNDQGSTGFPYNNTGRSRINGLGGDGISFINTGRGRDLGGALVAINTTGVENVGIQWLGGTLIRNDRIYAIRLQYRVGTEGRFHDVVHNGRISQYIVSNAGHTEALPAIKLPEAAMGEEYVQLLWKYYNIAVDSGPRAQLRLDDIVVGDLEYDDLGADERQNLQDTRVFPNPAANIVNIASSSRIKSVNVYHISGDLVYTHIQEGYENSLPVGHLNTGIYFFRVVTAKGVEVHKVMVRH